MLTNLFFQLRQAFQNLSANKLRSVLTMLGILIGVSSVIIMLTVGKGAERLVLSELEDLGSNLIFVLAGEEDTNVISIAELTSFKNSDVDALKDKSNVPTLKTVSSFSALSREEIKVGKNEQIAMDISGVDREFFPMSNYTFAEGNVWTEDDEKALKKVVVVGGEAKSDIFGENAGNVVGARIKIKGQSYEVVGVLENKDAPLASLFGDNPQERLMIPTQAAQKFVLGIGDYVYGVMAEAISEEAIPQAKIQITELLRERHRLREDKKNDFTIQTQDEFLDVLGTVTSIFTLFLASIGAISLLVGGVGIMNIMLVVVTERIKEIGLRKAVGASRTDILLQFLIEALLLTLLGGILGIIVGLGVSYLIAQIAGFSFQIDIWVLLLATGVITLFGLVFGIYPANEASKLDPIKALRHE